jgi:hypothetical protein
MIVEPAGSSFLTAQKTRGRAYRFFACHFPAYAQGEGRLGVDEPVLLRERVAVTRARIGCYHTEAHSYPGEITHFTCDGGATEMKSGSQLTRR